MSGNLPYILNMPRTTARTSRIEARIAPEALHVVRQAAELQGRSVSDFVVAAAQDAARRTLEEASVLRLSREDQLAFAKALIEPGEPAPAMQRAFERHKTLIRPT